MLKGTNPRLEKRSNLLGKFMELGMSLDTMLEMTRPMHGKTDEEKEQIAADLLEELENRQDSANGSSKKTEMY